MSQSTFSSPGRTSLPGAPSPIQPADERPAAGHTLSNHSLTSWYRTNNNSLVGSPTASFRAPRDPEQIQRAAAAQIITEFGIGHDDDDHEERAVDGLLGEHLEAINSFDRKASMARQSSDLKKLEATLKSVMANSDELRQRLNEQHEARSHLEEENTNEKLRNNTLQEDLTGKKEELQRVAEQLNSMRRERDALAKALEKRAGRMKAYQEKVALSIEELEATTRRRLCSEVVQWQIDLRIIQLSIAVNSNAFGMQQHLEQLRAQSTLLLSTDMQTQTDQVDEEEAPRKPIVDIVDDRESEAMMLQAELEHERAQRKALLEALESERKRADDALASRDQSTNASCQTEQRKRRELEDTVTQLQLALTAANTELNDARTQQQRLSPPPEKPVAEPQRNVAVVVVDALAASTGGGEPLPLVAPTPERLFTGDTEEDFVTLRMQERMKRNDVILEETQLVAKLVRLSVVLAQEAAIARRQELLSRAQGQWSPRRSPTPNRHPQHSDLRPWYPAGQPGPHYNPHKTDASPRRSKSPTVQSRYLDYQLRTPSNTSRNQHNTGGGGAHSHGSRTPPPQPRSLSQSSNVSERLNLNILSMRQLLSDVGKWSDERREGTQHQQQQQQPKSNGKGGGGVPAHLLNTPPGQRF